MGVSCLVAINFGGLCLKTVRYVRVHANGVCVYAGTRGMAWWRVGDVVVSNVARCRTARGAQIFRAASYGDIFRASPLSSCSHNLSNFH